MPARRPRRGAPSGGPLPVSPRDLPFARGEPTARTAALAVAALTALGLVVRLAIPRGLWLDEAISVHQAQLGLPELIQNLAQSDRHPPLHALVLWADIHVFGSSDLAVRLPSIAAGTLLVPGLYWLGHELYDRRTGLASALLGTVAPLLVWYSQEARDYVFVTLFAALTVLGCARVMRRAEAADWILYTVSAALLVWSHWFGGLVVVVTEAALVGMVVRRRGARLWLGIRWAASTLVLAALLAPLAVLAGDQLHATGTGGGFNGPGAGGTGVSFYTVTSNLSWLFGGFHPEWVSVVISAVWPLAMLASLLVVGVRVRRPTVLLLACALGPILALLVMGVFNPGVFDARYFIASAPLFVVLAGRIGALKPVALAATFVVLAVALSNQQLDPANPRRYDYREALATLQHRLGPHDVLLYEPPELRYVLERYAPRLVARPLDGTLPNRREAQRVVVLASFQDQERYRNVVDRQIGTLRYFRHQTGRGTWPGVTTWSFR
ncbi:MAG TPA: glycosyltransferase family 39 protein [Solirubrobacteraceae bacterium]|nr:glycosyltransferase family 39 protein [Solirubrobacteraceae bacterium]